MNGWRGHGWPNRVALPARKALERTSAARLQHRGLRDGRLRSTPPRRAGPLPATPTRTDTSFLQSWKVMYMGKIIMDMRMSLDGFIAAKEDSPDKPLGEDGERLHEWLSKDKPAFEKKLCRCQYQCRCHNNRS